MYTHVVEMSNCKLTTVTTYGSDVNICRRTWHIHVWEAIRLYPLAVYVGIMCIVIIILNCYYVWCDLSIYNVIQII